MHSKVIAGDLAGKGKEYSNIPNLRVYGREGQLCRKCQSVIERTVIGGRSGCYSQSAKRRNEFDGMRQQLVES